VSVLLVKILGSGWNVRNLTTLPSLRKAEKSHTARWFLPALFLAPVKLRTGACQNRSGDMLSQALRRR